MLTILAKEKNLIHRQKLKDPIYIKDFAEFTQVILTTILMTFKYSWLCIQFLLFLQFAAIIGSCLVAL